MLSDQPLDHYKDVKRIPSASNDKDAVMCGQCERRAKVVCILVLCIKWITLKFQGVGCGGLRPRENSFHLSSVRLYHAKSIGR